MSALAPEGRLHAPNGDKRSRRDAVTLLDGCKERRIGLLERAPARRNDRAAAPREKLVERRVEAMLAPVGRDGCGRIMGRHQGRDRCGADAPSPRFLRELLLPRLESSGRTAALGSARFAA